MATFFHHTLVKSQYHFKKRKLSPIIIGINKLPSIIFFYSCVAAWPEMQELVISGNNVCHLPENVCNWYYLKIFRAHSNLLTTSPSFVNNNALKVITEYSIITSP